MTAILEDQTAEVETAESVRLETRAIVRAAHLAETADHSRLPHSVRVSKIAGCLQEAAHSLAGTEPTDNPEPQESRAANHGTWIHRGLLPRMATAIDGAYEIDVELAAAGIRVEGTADLTGKRRVYDVKTKKSLAGVRRYGPDGDHVMQLKLYCLAEAQAGRRPSWAIIIYIDRATGEDEPFALEVTDAFLLDAVDRVREIRRHAEADPDLAPRALPAATPGGLAMRLRGPGKSYSCNECPWLKRCWGPDAVPGEVGAQRNIARTDTQVEAALAAYDAAAAIKSNASKDTDFFRAVLDGKPAGNYGPYRLAWKSNNSIDVTRLDAAEA